MMVQPQLVKMADPFDTSEWGRVQDGENVRADVWNVGGMVFSGDGYNGTDAGALLDLRAWFSIHVLIDDFFVINNGEYDPILGIAFRASSDFYFCGIGLGAINYLDYIFRTVRYITIRYTGGTWETLAQTNRMHFETPVISIGVRVIGESIGLYSVEGFAEEPWGGILRNDVTDSAIDTSGVVGLFRGGSVNLPNKGLCVDNFTVEELTNE